MPRWLACLVLIVFALVGLAGFVVIAVFAAWTCLQTLLLLFNR